MRVRGWNSCGQSVWWDSISSQVLEPISPKLSGDVGDHHGSAQFKYEQDLLSLKFFWFLTLFQFFTIFVKNPCFFSKEHLCSLFECTKKPDSPVVRKSEGVGVLLGYTFHHPAHLLNLHCNSPKILVYQKLRFVLSTPVLLWFGHVSSFIIPQHKSTSVLVYSFKGHQDWTILSGVKGVSKFTLAMNNPVD